MDIIKAEGINEKGYGIIAKSVMTDQRLKIAAKAIYAYFCSYAGAGGRCFPSRDKICYDLNITANTYTKHLRTLIQCGYISVKQERDNGRWARNVYTLNSVIPCIKKPCTKKSDTKKTVYQNLSTKNNNIKNNNIIINNSCCSNGDGEKEQFENLYMPEEDYGCDYELYKMDFDDAKKMERCGTHGCVLLNGDQQEKLLNILSLDEFDDYIDRLDDYIYRKKARPKNHYLTIKKWVNEDRGV